jgi:small subunit ribosomal protein S2
VLEGRANAAADVVRAVSEGSDEFVEVQEGAA